MKTSSRALIFSTIAFIALAVAAKTFGPFLVSALGPKYANTTLGGDSNNEYEVAQKLANTYMAPMMVNPIQRANILKSGIMRVVYFDGQIADFRIERWPSSIPVTFDQVVPSAGFPRATISDAANVYCTTGQTIIRTGYWGSDAWLDNLGNWVIVGGWVDTGIISFNPQKINCR